MPDLSEPLALVLVAVVTVVGSVVTTKAANRANKNRDNAALMGTIESARVAAEEHAFERAREGYEAAIGRRDIEISELESDIGKLRKRIAELEEQVHGLTVELETAKNALRLRYPDEP